MIEIWRTRNTKQRVASCEQMANVLPPLSYERRPQESVILGDLVPSCGAQVKVLRLRV